MKPERFQQCGTNIQKYDTRKNRSHVRAFEEKQTEVLENCRAELSELSVRYEKWTQAVSDYDDYKQYQPVMKEYQALNGLRKNSFKKKHETELENYAIYRDRVKAVMPENMKISNI